MTGLGWFAAVAIANHALLGTKVVEDGDLAANSLLIDRALDGRLLVGNYSLVGFNHPGPGILAMQAAGQAVFQRALDVVSAPYAGQFLGIIALNAICIGVATRQSSTGGPGRPRPGARPARRRGPSSTCGSRLAWRPRGCRTPTSRRSC